jgi:DNA-binding transcriptional MerR regulator
MAIFSIYVDAMPDDLLTLAELSERSGVEIRTLRSWIAQGVVPGAGNAGRNARYSAAALTRARAAKALREVYGLSLPDIRQDLLIADEAKIEGYAARAGAAPSGAREEPAPAPSPPPAGTSAADYLRNLRNAGLFGAASSTGAARPAVSASLRGYAPPPRPDPEPPSGSRLARLAEALERIAGARPSRRKAKGDVRLHIPITPDLELTVRGDHTPEEIARYEQVADLLRAILTGGFEP